MKKQKKTLPKTKRESAIVYKILKGFEHLLSHDKTISLKELGEKYRTSAQYFYIAKKWNWINTVEDKKSPIGTRNEVIKDINVYDAMSLIEEARKQNEKYKQKNQIKKPNKELISDENLNDIFNFISDEKNTNNEQIVGKIVYNSKIAQYYLTIRGLSNLFKTKIHNIAISISENEVYIVFNPPENINNIKVYNDGKNHDNIRINRKAIIEKILQGLDINYRIRNNVIDQKITLKKEVEFNGLTFFRIYTNKE